MISAKIHPEEEKRLESLLALKILDTLPEKDFDEITLLASQICQTPIALISLVAEDRQWFKSRHGIEAKETPREFAFCGHAILQDQVFEVEDASQDERFCDNPLSTGELRVQFYAGAPLLSPDGHPIGTLCVIDSKPKKLSPIQVSALRTLSGQITRLLQLKVQIQKLRESEDQLMYKTTAAESVEEGIVLQDSNGKIVDFNPSSLRILDLSEEQLLGRNTIDPQWRRVRADGSTFSIEMLPSALCLKTGQKQSNVLMGLYNSKNELQWLRINSVPLYLEKSEKPTHAVTSFADITLEIERQNALITKSKDLRLILDTIPHMIGHWDANLINLNSNSIYSEFFKKTPEEIHGLHIRDVLGEDIYKRNLPYLNEALNGKKVSFERLLPHKDGSIRHTLATYHPNFTNGKVTSILAIVIDVTEMKVLEEKRQSLEALLAESARLSSLGEMAGGVAHEINNPLTIISGRIDILKRLLEKNTLNATRGQTEFQSIEETIQRITKIIRGLSSYSRRSENDPFKSVGVFDIIEETIAISRDKFKLSSVEIRINCDPKIRAECRASQISQILMNLLNNSLDVVSRLNERWIEVNVNENPNSIAICVRDSGSGIEASIVKKIMEPFYTTKASGTGTGLGLSISTALAQAHNGSLHYDPKEKNTSFVLTIPKFQNQKHTSAA